MLEATSPHSGYSDKAVFKNFTKLKERIRKFSLYSHQFKFLLDPVTELLEWHVI